MVKLEEVLDEEFSREQQGPIDEDDWDTDSESDAESVTSSIAPDETFLERLSALKDMIPPTARNRFSSTVSTTSSLVRSSGLLLGRTLWVVSTSVMLLGVPWALAYAEEQQMVEMEREMKMQQSANELLAPGSTTGQPQAQPAL